MTGKELEIEKRRERGRSQRFMIKNVGTEPIFSLFSVKSVSGNTYRVEIRSISELINRCSCPDYETNALGTCKHIEATLIWLRKNFPKEFRMAKKEVKKSFLTLSYDGDITRIRLVKNTPIPGIIEKYFSDDGYLKGSIKDIKRMLGEQHEVEITDEVKKYINCYEEKENLEKERERLVRNIKKGKEKFVKLKYPLFPYQLLGSVFLSLTQRAILADDMGLGKTVQAIASSIYLKKLKKVKRVLVISPASLKHQWKSEIEKFCDEKAVVIEGTKAKRKKLYNEKCFFHILNYELTYRDKDEILSLNPDLVILDEAQRIKNWKAKTTQTVKSIRSKYAFILTGTPLENRLEELYSVVQFIDPILLGPAWKFMERYTERDEWGGIAGYKRLDEVREKISPIFLRRRKDEVMDDLPPRLDETYTIELTGVQRMIHDAYRSELKSIYARNKDKDKWPKEDLARLLELITYMREVCDSTLLVGETVKNHSAKLKELSLLLDDIVIEGGHKALIFSQWERMTSLIETLLNEIGIGYEYLWGGVKPKKRPQLVSNFNKNPECMVFLSTDAGGLGLNLQSASYVINIELPWNPAVLEQRISRAHRMGQRKPVTSINLLSDDSIEDRVYSTIQKKRELFNAVIEGYGTEFKVDSRQEELRKLVEVIIGKA